MAHAFGTVGYVQQCEKDGKAHDERVPGGFKHLNECEDIFALLATALILVNLAVDFKG